MGKTITRKPRQRRRAKMASATRVRRTAAVAGLRAFAEDHAWVARHYQELLLRYSERWIAVDGCRVVASDSDFEGLLAKLPDPANTCIEFITREPLGMVL